MKIILASSSIYRKQLLDKMGLFYECAKPPLDEDLLKNELIQKKYTAVKIAETLSQAKGQSVLAQHTETSDLLIISSDQLVCFENRILGKPGTFEKAKEQLLLLNNKNHQLITAVSLNLNGRIIHKNHITNLKMKKLGTEEISNYILKDQPLDCAGSYKIEQSGIVLFDSIECDDFTAIQGLPTIWLSNQLKEIGYEFFKK